MTRYCQGAEKPFPITLRIGNGLELSPCFTNVIELIPSLFLFITGIYRIRTKYLHLPRAGHPFALRAYVKVVVSVVIGCLSIVLMVRDQTGASGDVAHLCTGLAWPVKIPISPCVVV